MGPTWRPFALLAAVALLAAPSRAAAQGWPAGAAGGVLGLGAGGYVALGIVTLKARHGDYLFGVDDVFGWESTAVLAGTASGVALGLWDRGRLRRAAFAGAAGAAVGTAVGAWWGRRTWPEPEGVWAGGVIGGAAGLLLGAAVGALWPVRGDDGGAARAPGVGVSLTVPVGP